jgi:hypothetical protein
MNFNISKYKLVLEDNQETHIQPEKQTLQIKVYLIK